MSDKVNSLDVTISIVSHAHGKLLDALLCDLEKSNALNKYKVVVTLNVPEIDFDFQKWKNFNLEWIKNKEPKGFGANHNCVLLNANTKWVLVLNPDIRIGEDILEKLVSFASKQPNLGIAAPCIKSSHGDIEDSIRSNLTPFSLLSRYLIRHQNFNKLLCNTRDSDFDWIAGMFLLIPTEIYKSVKGFDERFYLYCEDYDLCARIRLNNYKLYYIDNLEVIHCAQRSSRRQIKYLYWHLNSLFKVWGSRTFWRFSLALASKKLPNTSCATQFDK